MKDIFEPASWSPNKHLVINDETLLEASSTGLDLNWSSISSDIGATLAGYTVAFDGGVYDLTDVYSELHSYESLRINLKGTALADFIKIGGMANQDDFKSYWFLGAGDDIIKADDAAGLTLVLRDGFENLASGSPEWISGIAYEAFWDRDHYQIAVSQDGNLLGTTTTYGPLTDIDISADTTIVLSDRGEDIEYVSGRADVTLGEGTDLIQLSFEEQSTSSLRPLMHPEHSSS